MMEKKDFKFSIHLSEEEYEQLQEIKEENAGIKNNHDVYKILINSYFNHDEAQLHELRNLKLQLSILLEVVGQLMFESNGFKNKNGLPISEITLGADYIGVQNAKKRVLKKIRDVQQRKASH